jgi:hypothetical protein
MLTPLLNTLINPKRLTVFGMTFSGFFYLNYWAMANLPGHTNNMCVPGGNLNTANVLISLLISVLIGFTVVGLAELISQKRMKASLKAGSTSTIGAAFGIVTSFCTACTLPVLSLFGLSISLTFFTTYELWFKSLSILLLSFAIYMLNRQLADNCMPGSCAR